MKCVLPEIEEFARDYGLSDHRAGLVLANNGRLIERLRSGRRIWPETKQAIRRNIRKERARRGEPKTLASAGAS